MKKGWKYRLLSGFSVMILAGAVPMAVYAEEESAAQAQEASAETAGETDGEDPALVMEAAISELCNEPKKYLSGRNPVFGFRQLFGSQCFMARFLKKCASGVSGAAAAGMGVRGDAAGKKNFYVFRSQ